MKKMSLLILVLITTVSCSRKFERDYSVVDASHQDIPEWINEPTEWASDNDNEDDPKKHRYYVFSTEPKNSKTIACEIAKARASAEIATEITQFIKHSLATSSQGDPTKKNEKLAEYVEDTLAKEVQSFVVGAKVYKTYWEKRKYEKEKGAKRNWTGTVCSSLTKIAKKNLSKAVKRAHEKLDEVVKDDAEAKQNVKEAMKKAEEEYSK